jgi:hypothetical protein
MSERIRRGLAFIIAIGMVIAVAAAPSVAQTIDPDAERVFEIAGLNADKVDGQHAVKYSTKKSKRANKLVATNAAGYLPSNIVKPGWGYIKNKPAGFADGVDNAGVTQVRMRHVRKNGTIAGNSSQDFAVYCPEGFVVTGGGIGQAASDIRIVDTEPLGWSGWYVNGLNLGSNTREVSVYAVCMSTTPGGALKRES